jgi:sulfoquinovose isomerase
MESVFPVAAASGAVGPPGSPEWLAAECARLIRFARAARLPAGGFGWLDDRGAVRADEPVHTYVTARMTHVFALAHLLGDPDAAALVDHGLAALADGPLRDHEHGGWYSAVDRDGRPLSTDKSAYAHAFVVLAASSATAAGRPGAPALLAQSLSIVDRHFWHEDDGRLVESWDRRWRTSEDYRGANSNMHAVEAFLAAGDVTGDTVWHRRALRIATEVVHAHAQDNGWRLIEHFHADWSPWLGYNDERPDDPFRPFGATIGHSFEWARLLLSLDATMPDPPAWLRLDAVELFDAAVRDGWAVDGSDGFVYTVDWSGRPVVGARMHWVLAEAVSAAATLHRVTGDDRYLAWYRAWWEYADKVLLDREHGSWHHELTCDNSPAATVWSGKPDAYHAVQATLIPGLPPTPALAEALRRRALG